MTEAPHSTIKHFVFFLALLLCASALLIWPFYMVEENWNIGTTPTGLAPLAFKPLPLGRVKPQGWLLEQLRLQGAGLTGHLDEFWPDVKDSGWRGGTAEGWERAPYWLDGLIPLAYLTDDARLKAKAKDWVDTILEHAQPDGWLGPEQGVGLGPWGGYATTPTPHRGFVRPSRRADLGAIRLYPPADYGVSCAHAMRPPRS